MANGSRIEWTEATWNPVTGCTRVSSGCDNCYAARMSYRLERMGNEAYAGLTVLNGRGGRHFNGIVRCHPDRLDMPRRWRKPRLVFVNSMSDLFHKKVPLSFIKQVFDVMNECPQHTFQVLTKRPEIAARHAAKLEWTDNIWIGTSVEDEFTTHRIADLVKIKAAVRFLSLEPLLGPLPILPLDGIHWVILGGESGPGARPMKRQWVRQVRDRCIAHGVPFFFKQWGGVNKESSGRVLDGELWSEIPTPSLQGEHGGKRALRA
jgi:protein gp37